MTQPNAARSFYSGADSARLAPWSHASGASANNAFHCEMEPNWLLRAAFMAGIDGDTISATARFGIEISGLDFLDAVVVDVTEACGERPRMIGYHPFHFSIEIPGQLQVQVVLDGRKELQRETRGHFTVEVFGERNAALAMHQLLQKRFGDGRLATVHWWFKNGDRCDMRHVIMEPTKPVYDEFYPFLDQPVEKFIDSYLASSSSILFMMGEPGTGKTSLVRHMVYTRRLDATMTYDHDLLERDQIFVNFLTSDEDGVLIIEDADTMLGSRESEGNKLISRFLNVSDGLIKMQGKKIVVTTNLGDFTKVDPALVRPGRCFGSMKFRALTAKEASAAAHVAGVEDPGCSVRLADLFNVTAGAPEIAAIGF